MSRYIDSEKIDCVAFKGIPDGYKDTFADGVLYVLNRIDEQPTVDAVKVVRCKDCKWGKETCGNIECFVDLNAPSEYHGYEWFCPYGEKR